MDLSEIHIDQRLRFDANPQTPEDEITAVSCRVTALPDPDDFDEDETPWVQVTITVYVRPDELSPLED